MLLWILRVISTHRSYVAIVVDILAKSRIIYSLTLLVDVAGNVWISMGSFHWRHSLPLLINLSSTCTRILLNRTDEVLVSLRNLAVEATTVSLAL